VLVIAHRGDSRVAPENTLPAFASAVRAGADLVELDYRVTNDGSLVAIHDATLDRTSDACARWGKKNLAVCDATLDELRAFDLGRWSSPAFAGTRLPTLDEAIDTIRVGAVPVLERKAGSASATVDLLRRKEVLEHVVVMGFDWPFLAECRRLAPDLVLAALGEHELTEAALDQIATTGATVVGWSNETMDAAAIAAIHRRGWKAWVWTADDEPRWRALIELGIDAITTNRPGPLRAILASTS
jgi:glycerophosphoryl diester phosphodiesterase